MPPSAMIGVLRKELLLDKTVILASTSPRRNELLGSIGMPFFKVGSTFDENLDKKKFHHPCQYVLENSKQKALDVWLRICKEQTRGKDPKNYVVIGADTIVTVGQQILEKPKSREDAYNMLKTLSGRAHIVFTGVTLIKSVNEYNAMAIKTFHETTEVWMTSLDDQAINSYIDTYEPFDKAGSYAIQGIGATLIERVNGDYFNVVGLPLHRLCKELDSFLAEL